MRRVPKVTQAMRASLRVVQDRNGNPLRGGIMHVPRQPQTPEEMKAWEREAMAEQGKLMESHYNPDKGKTR